jgi:peptidoglycan/xylan/chitin deacetylase (PgdA/CDA1 family)
MLAQRPQRSVRVYPVGFRESSMPPLAEYIYTDARIERWVSGVLGCWATIFTLHRPTPVDGAYEGCDPDLLAQCLSFVQARGYEFLSIDEMVGRALKGEPLRRCVCFTMDDGFADQLDVLAPVLLRFDAKPTLFVISDLIDGTAWPWDNQLAYMFWQAKSGSYSLIVDGQLLEIKLDTPDSRKINRRIFTRIAKGLTRTGIVDLVIQLQKILQVEIPLASPKEYQPATWSQLRDFEARGLRIGCHAKSHFTFSALTEAEIVSELKHSKQRLVDEVANPSSIFCYPSGTQKDFALHHEPLVQQAGFLAAVSTLSKNTSTDAIQAAPFRIERIGMPQDFNHFVRYISWLEHVRGRMG